MQTTSRLEYLHHMKIMANDLASSRLFCLQKIKVADSPSSSSRPPSITLNTNEDIQPHVAGLTVWPLTSASIFGDLDMQQKRGLDPSSHAWGEYWALESLSLPRLVNGLKNGEEAIMVMSAH